MAELVTGEALEQVQRLGWFIRLRWLAAAGVAGTILVIERVLPVRLDPEAKTAALAVAGLIFAYNILFYLDFRGFRRSSDGAANTASRVHRRQWGQVLADLVALTVLLDLAGGLINPLCLFMIFHVAIAAVLFSRGEAFVVAGLAAGLLLGLGGVGALAPAWRFPVTGFALEGMGLAGRWDYILPVWLTLSSTFLLIALFVSGVSGELRRTLGHLAEANAALEAQTEAKVRFMRVMAHHMRSPLSAMISLSQAYLASRREAGGDAQLLDFLERVRRRATAMMQLVDDLLRLAGLREGGVDAAPPERIDFRRTVLDACQLAGPRAREKGLVLEADVADEPAFILARQRDAVDIVENLLSNAIKYTEKGSVRLAAQPTDGRYRLTVTDTGIGIPEKDQAKLFTEFFRASNAKAADPHSSGLGLNILKAVIDRLGGSIRFTSREGEGTTFTVELPLAAKPADADVPGSGPPPS